jgi:hypothetical protein
MNPIVAATVLALAASTSTTEASAGVSAKADIPQPQTECLVTLNDLKRSMVSVARVAAKDRSQIT